MSNFYSVHRDAFSNGQIDSKLWLCEELENLFDTVDTVWIYGGWYGVTGFLLRTRNKIQIKSIRSYDIDPGCEPVADMINENWVFKEWQFKAITADCNNLRPIPGNPDLVINTSTEHFESYDWWHRIPKGTTVALQGNNMIHGDHHIHSNTLEEFLSDFPMSRQLYTGQKHFQYPNWEFTRYMIIGTK